jgi:hypothetical protein
MNTNENKLYTIIASVILVLLIVAAVAFCVKIFTKTNEQPKFYLVNKGEEINGEMTEIILNRGETETFNIVYEENYTGDKADYDISVELFPNENNFYFEIDSEQSSFYATPSKVTDFFEIDMQEEYFTITLNENFKITDVIQQIYDGKNVTFDDEIDCSKAYLKIVVWLSDETKAYEIPFRCIYDIEEISINEESAPKFFGGEGIDD